MTSFILSAIFSWLGISVITVMLIAAIVGSIALSLPKEITWVLCFILAGYLYTGYVFREADAACREQVRVEVDQERRRQEAVGAQKVQQLEAQLASLQKDRDADRLELEELQTWAAATNTTGRGATPADLKAYNGGRG